MKNLIYFFVILFALFMGCKKETNEAIVNVSKDLIKEMNYYVPDVTQIETIVSNFQKEKIAYQEHISGNKDLVIIGDKAIDLSIFLMEAVLNFERGNIEDTTLIFEKNEKMEFTVNTKGYDYEGKILLDGNDLMIKYIEAEKFAIDNNIDEYLKFVNITLQKIENDLAYFDAEKVVTKKGLFVLGEEEFDANTVPVMAVDPLICAGYTSSLPGYKLIDQKIFTQNYSSPVCINGGSIIYYNFSPPHFALWGNTFVNDPVLGTGTLGNLGLVFDVSAQHVWPNSCLDYTKLNQYLNGARKIYKRWMETFPSNLTVIEYRMEKYKEHILIDDFYYIAMPIKYTTANWYCTAMNN